MGDIIVISIEDSTDAAPEEPDYYKERHTLSVLNSNVPFCHRAEDLTSLL